MDFLENTDEFSLKEFIAAECSNALTNRLRIRFANLESFGWHKFSRVAVDDDIRPRREDSRKPGVYKIDDKGRYVVLGLSEQEKSFFKGYALAFLEMTPGFF